MNVTEPAFALATFLIAAGSIRCLNWNTVAERHVGGFEALDGLRGILSFSVFLSHVPLWYVYLKTGNWALSGSRLYTHLGQTSVSLFFMITGCLFAAKILDGRTRPIDWQRLYVGRILRLAPLYFLFLLIMFGLVAYESGFEIKDSTTTLLKSAIRWALFTIPGAPSLNQTSEGFSNAVGGVVWSLPYEWLYYLALPILALPVRVRVPQQLIMIAFVAIGIMLKWLPEPTHLAAFIGGVFGACAARLGLIRRFARSTWASAVATGCIVYVAFNYDSAYGLAPRLLTGVAFTLVACENTLFGLLSTRVARLLGDASYSVYLLHGPVVYVAFVMIIGRARASAMSVAEHWLTIAVITPILLLVCSLTYRLVEKPMMRRGGDVSSWLRSHRSTPKICGGTR